jgi:hypothetical protein
VHQKGERVQEDLLDSELALVSTKEGLEIIDSTLGQWIVRFEAADFAPEMHERKSAIGNAVLQTFSSCLPHLSASLPRGGRGLRVVFSPEVQHALTAGTYRLMKSGGEMPVALDGAGKIVQIARVLPGGAATAGGGIALGATAVAAWPVALAAAVATAAAWAEQRWLEKTFNELRSYVGRIEARLRDDDFGTLEAADNLVELIRHDALGGSIPTFQKWRLAAAQQSVEAIYLSRRRFVERFKRSLEDRQTQYERERGTTVAWVDGVVDELGDGTKGVREELTVFLASMVTRARVTAASAAALASEGEAVSALKMIDRLETSLREDYHDLYRRLAALARQAPTTSTWKRLFPSHTAEAERAWEFVQSLSFEMQRSIGASLPERTEQLVLEADLEPVQIDPLHSVPPNS